MEVTDTNNEGSHKMENNMTSDELNKIARNLVDDIKRLHSRLDEVQDACTHKETRIEMIEGHLKKSCIYCYRVVGYPTHEEIRNAGYNV